MQILYIYLLGIVTCGLLYSMLFFIDSFNVFYDNNLDTAYNELTEKQKNKIGKINKDSYKFFDIIITSLFSWLGIIYVLILLIIYAVNKQ